MNIYIHQLYRFRPFIFITDRPAWVLYVAITSSFNSDNDQWSKSLNVLRQTSSINFNGVNTIVLLVDRWEHLCGHSITDHPDKLSLILRGLCEVQLPVYQISWTFLPLDMANMTQNHSLEILPTFASSNWFGHFRQRLREPGGNRIMKNGRAYLCSIQGLTQKMITHWPCGAKLFRKSSAEKSLVDISGSNYASPTEPLLLPSGQSFIGPIRYTHSPRDREFDKEN